jgi:hypothetical protein
MHTDTRRITLVARHLQDSGRNFNRSLEAPSRVIAMESALVLRYALNGCLSGMATDVERVILGEASSAEEYLSLLASLPADFLGEVLFIKRDGNAFLSATGRGGNRVLYALSSADVDFYLDTHALVHASGRELSERAA